jgi:hypothetical protein
MSVYTTNTNRSGTYTLRKSISILHGPVDTEDGCRGHTLGSHTWSHADLTTLDEAGINNGRTFYPQYCAPADFFNLI